MYHQVRLLRIAGQPFQRECQLEPVALSYATLVLFAVQSQQLSRQDNTAVGLADIDAEPRSYHIAGMVLQMVRGLCV